MHLSTPLRPFYMPLMRKIETQMIQAIKDNTNWTSANTTVTLEDGISKVYLYGNLIAEIDEDSMKLYDGGYQSKTTKSRLNALLNAFGYTCGTKNEQVFQQNWTWFVRVFNETFNEMQTVKFTSGMRLA